MVSERLIYFTARNESWYRGLLLLLFAGKEINHTLSLFLLWPVKVVRRAKIILPPPNRAFSLRPAHFFSIIKKEFLSSKQGKVF